MAEINGVVESQVNIEQVQQQRQNQPAEQNQPPEQPPAAQPNDTVSISQEGIQLSQASREVEPAGRAEPAQPESSGGEQDIVPQFLDVEA